MRGVPRERWAISRAPPSSIGTAISRAAAQHKDTVDGLDGFIDLCDAQETATAALERLVHEHGGRSIMSYNDHATDKQQVLDLFDKAIAGLEERGE